MIKRSKVIAYRSYWRIQGHFKTCFSSCELVLNGFFFGSNIICMMKQFCHLILDVLNIWYTSENLCISIWIKYISQSLRTYNLYIFAQLTWVEFEKTSSYTIYITMSIFADFANLSVELWILRDYNAHGATYRKQLMEIHKKAKVNFSKRFLCMM